jgi:hypothetical protein
VRGVARFAFPATGSSRVTCFQAASFFAAIFHCLFRAFPASQARWQASYVNVSPTFLIQSILSQFSCPSNGFGKAIRPYVCIEDSDEDSFQERALLELLLSLLGSHLRRQRCRNVCRWFSPAQEYILRYPATGMRLPGPSPYGLNGWLRSKVVMCFR